MKMDSIDTKTANEMFERGGAFAHNLAHCMVVADPDQLARIKSAFPELMERYRPAAPIETPPGIWQTVDSLCKPATPCDFRGGPS